MISLWLLAAHLIGDYVLQTRWQANGKFGWTSAAVRLRSTHVLTYMLPFAIVAAAYGDYDGPRDVFSWRVTAFMALLMIAHWLTDSRRFTSTLGDVLAWRSSSKAVKLEPNPWPTIPLALDQTLHVVQIAVLAEAFLV